MEAAPGSQSPVSPLATDGYEREREARIRENMERMQKLGILDLASRFNQSAGAGSGRGRWRRKPETPGSVEGAPRMKHAAPSPARRSLRLKNVDPVSYAEVCTKDENDVKGGSSILLEVGSKEEVYTEEHEKLLGTCETPWTLFVDGCDKDGKRIYCQVRGQTCHQCRQKTLGHRTRCCKCQIVQGQFCGDCLYMRYGENVLEAKRNPNWVCPVCRGICNCSICRTKKGWFPTGNAYRKVVRLGYKSVAHYLIATQQSSANSADSSSADSSDNLPSTKSETSISEHAMVAKQGSDDTERSSRVNEKGRSDSQAMDSDVNLKDIGEIDQNEGNEKPAVNDTERSSKVNQKGRSDSQAMDSDVDLKDIGEIDQNEGNEKPAVNDKMTRAKAQRKATAISKDDGRSESVVTFDSLECQANQDIGCVTPSKPEPKKRKLIERSPDCVASRLRFRSAKS